MPYRLKLNDEVVQVWSHVPSKINIPDVGTVHAIKPGWTSGGYLFEEYQNPAPTPQPPSILDVIAERERRLSLGFDYDFKDARGVHHIGTTVEDMKGWDEVSTAASAMMMLGVRDDAVLAIVTDTGPVVVTPFEWQFILVAASKFRQPIWTGSFVLQAMRPIPDDYAKNDAYWSA